MDSTVLSDAAGWIAPAATAIAAIMTAVNLGARVTGWGFVVFLIGSLAWIAVALATGQTNLLLTNGFLSIVNLIGIWRWLGRQARYEKGGQAAAKASEGRAASDLRTLSSLIGAKVETDAGDPLGEAIEAMLACDDGRLDYIVVRSGGVAGVGERLQAVRAQALVFDKDRIRVTLSTERFEALPDWTPEVPPPRP